MPFDPFVNFAIGPGDQGDDPQSCRVFLMAHGFDEYPIETEDGIAAMLKLTRFEFRLHAPDYVAVNQFAADGRKRGIAYTSNRWIVSLESGQPLQGYHPHIQPFEMLCALRAKAGIEEPAPPRLTGYVPSKSQENFDINVLQRPDGATETDAQTKILEAFIKKCAIERLVAVKLGEATWEWEQTPASGMDGDA